ncbi:MAG: FMN-binding protein, partial [Planctomycetota bacterium]
MPNNVPHPHHHRRPFDRWVGRVLLLIAAIALIVSHLNRQPLQDTPWENQLTDWRPGEPQTVSLESGDRQAILLLPPSPQDEGGIVFSTKEIGAEVEGYNGPIELGVFLAPNGDIRNLMILKHVETPSYMAML